MTIDAALFQPITDSMNSVMQIVIPAVLGIVATIVGVKWGVNFFKRNASSS